MATKPRFEVRETTWGGQTRYLVWDLELNEAAIGWRFGFREWAEATCATLNKQHT